MIRHRPLLLGMTLCCGLVSACSPSKPHFDEAAMLTAAGFDKPLVMQVYLSGLIDASGHVVPNEMNKRIAFLVHSGFITLVPNSNSSSHYSYQLQNGMFQGSSTNLWVQVPVATRVVTGRSDDKSWTENATQFFAETISYRVALAPPLAAAMPASSTDAPHTLRITIVNDPAVDKWKLQSTSGDNMDDTDTQLPLAAIAAAGEGYLPELQQKYSAVVEGVQQQITRDLKAQFGIEKATDAHVWLQLRSHHAYYLPDGFVSRNAVYSEIKAYCAGIHSRGLAWRLPQRSDIQSLAVQQGNEKVIDTPQGDIWGGYFAPGTTIITDGWVGFAGDSSSGGHWVYQYLVQPDGAVTEQQVYADDARITVDQFPVVNNNWNIRNGLDQGPVKMFCIADTP